METYSVLELEQCLKGELSKIYRERAMEMIIDIDLRMPRCLTGNLDQTVEVILNKIQDVVQGKEWKLFILRMTYVYEKGGGSLLLLLGTQMLQNRMDNEDDTGRTEMMVLPHLLVEEGPLIRCEEKIKLIGYYERQQRADIRIRKAYRTLLEHLALQLDLPLVFCSTIQQLQMELQEEACSCLFLPAIQYRMHRDYFSHLPSRSRMILFGEAEDDEQSEIQMFQSLPFDSLDLARKLNEKRWSTKKNWNEIAGLDKKTGILYCGNETLYQQILRDYGERGKRTWQRIKMLYEAEDWENYTIEVHGIKSSMLAIGGVQVSEAAKALEMAGKDGDIDYIRKNHLKMLEQLIQLIQEIRIFFSMPLEEEAKEEKTDEMQSVLPLMSEECQELLAKLEDAAYGMDASEMERLTETLRNRSWKENSLGEVVKEAERKIKKDDLLSAFGLLEQTLSES